MREAREIADDEAINLLDYIDTMYPNMWKSVPQTARVSVRNRLTQRLTALIEADRRDTVNHLLEDIPVNGKGVMCICRDCRAKVVSRAAAIRSKNQKEGAK